MQVSALIQSRTRSVVTIAPDATVAQLTALLTEHGIGAVVVSTNGADIDGIVSERDIVRGLRLDGVMMHQPVSSIMTSQVLCVTSDATMDQLMRVMTERRARR